MQIPPNNAFMLGDEIRERLEAVKDQGTEIESGFGFGSRDIVVTVGGEEYVINIRPVRADAVREVPFTFGGVAESGPFPPDEDRNAL